MAKASKDETKDLVPTGAGAGLPAGLISDDELAEFQGQGISTDMRDQVAPFLRIAQSNSPELKKQHAKYIQGIEAGDMFITSTKEVITGEEGITLTPFYFVKCWLEWIDRNEGGGLVGQYDFATGEKMAKTCEKDDKNKLILPNGHELKETWYYFTLRGTDPSQVLIMSMSGTNLRSSRDWNSIASARRHNGMVLPGFMTTYRVKTLFEQKNENDYFRYSVGIEGWSSKEVVEAAKEAARLAKQGFYDLRKAAAADAAGDIEPGSTEADGIPF